MTTDTSSGAAGGRPPRSGRSSRPPGPGRTGASSSTSSTEVGWVGRPHGLDGAFHVTRPQPDAFAPGKATSIGTIVSVGGTPQKPVLRVEGIDSRADVEALRETPIVAELSLDEGEWWAEDLIGLRVVDGARAVGTVERVRAYPSCELLEVARTPPGGDNLLVPLIGDAVRTVDLEAGVVDVDLGFLGEG